MDSPYIKQTVCKVLKIFQYGKYLVAYVLNHFSFWILVNRDFDKHEYQTKRLIRHFIRVCTVCVVRHRNTHFIEILTGKPFKIQNRPIHVYGINIYGDIKVNINLKWFYRCNNNLRPATRIKTTIKVLSVTALIQTRILITLYQYDIHCSHIFILS